MSLFSDRIIQALCWTLLHSLWQGLLLAFITGIVMVLSKKASSALRYNLLSIIFIVFITVVCFTFSRQMHLATENKLVENVVSPGSAINPNNTYASPAIINAGTLQNYISGFINYFNVHASLIVTIWFIIFMARCVKILSGLVNIQRIRHYKTNTAPEQWNERVLELADRLQIRRHILLLESAIVKVPVVVGFLKPIILIPLGLFANLLPDQVEAILIHELAHIRRKDYFFNLLQRFVDILFFFNPAILWISSLIRNERENCCDDIAITETKSKKQFVQALVSFYEYNNSVSEYAMPFAETKNRLVKRVKRIVNNNNYTLNPVEKIVLAISLLVFSIAFITVTNGQTGTQKKQIEKSNTPSSKNNHPTPRSIDKNIHATVAGVNGKYDKPVKKIIKNTIETVIYSEGLPWFDEQAYNNELLSLGYKNISLERPQELKDHGVNADFINSFYRIGYKDISLERAQELKDHGVNADFINSFYRIGYKDISLERAQELKDHGVNADFIHSFYQMGYKDISLESAQNLEDHGVNAGFINSFYKIGYKDISLKEAKDLKDRGMNPDFIMGFIKMGYKDIPLETMQNLRDHGISPDFINGFYKIGYKNISLEEAQDLRDHGVSADFIKSFNEIGYKDISLEKAIELRDHGVNTEFIESIKRKKGADLSLDEYVILKDRL